MIGVQTNGGPKPTKRINTFQIPLLGGRWRYLFWSPHESGFLHYHQVASCLLTTQPARSWQEYLYEQLHRTVFSKLIPKHTNTPTDFSVDSQVFQEYKILKHMLLGFGYHHVAQKFCKTKYLCICKCELRYQKMKWRLHPFQSYLHSPNLELFQKQMHIIPQVEHYRFKLNAVMASNCAQLTELSEGLIAKIWSLISNNLPCKSNKQSKTRQSKRMLRTVPVFCSTLVLYHILGDPMTVNQRSAIGPEFLSLQDTEQNALLGPPQAERCLGKCDPRNTKNQLIGGMYTSDEKK